MDLKSVVEKYPESLNSAEKLRAYLTDLCPNEKAKVSITVSIFSCGIAEEIEKSRKIDDVTIKRFCTRLENDYGYSQKLSNECIDLWLEVYDKTITKPETVVLSPMTTTSTSNPPIVQTTQSKKSQPVISNKKIKKHSKPIAISSKPSHSNGSSIKQKLHWSTGISSTLIYVLFFYLWGNNYPEYQYNSVNLFYTLLYLVAPLCVLVLSIIFCCKSNTHEAMRSLVLSAVVSIGVGLVFLLGSVIILQFLGYSDASEEVHEYFKYSCRIGLIIDTVINSFFALVSFLPKD